jgi:hypothetical protein
MIEAHTYDGVCARPARAFEERYRLKDVNITGLLFARPESALAKAEVIPNIEYWHHRSDAFTDFFCAGYGAFGGPGVPSDSRRLDDVRHVEWWYSATAFNNFLHEVERRTRWTYKGGTDIIIVNARHDSKTHAAWLDFSSAIAINLEQAKKDEAMRDVPELAEAIFWFAKNINESKDDPVWAYSDQRGVRVLRRSLKDMLISFLPESLRPDAKAAFHFVTTDISRDQ